MARSNLNWIGTPFLVEFDICSNILFEILSEFGICSNRLSSAKLTFVNFDFLLKRKWYFLKIWPQVFT
jgi:hypothetical protein